MDMLVEELLKNDKAAISKLIDTRGCTSEKKCRLKRECACQRCELYRAAGLSRSEEVMALNIKVLFPITSMQTLYHLGDEIVAHGAAKATRLLPTSADITASLSQFLEFRFYKSEK